jgi:hypothetical protein
LIKKVLLTLLQFVLFVLACVAGIVLATLGILPSHITTLSGGTRGLQLDGIALMSILFVLILIIEAARKRTLLAFIAALLLAVKLSILSLV